MTESESPAGPATETVPDSSAALGFTPPESNAVDDTLWSRAMLATPILWRELAAVLAMLIYADLTLYRGQGFAGIGVFVATAPILLFLGSPLQDKRPPTWILGAMLLILGGRLGWLGSYLQVACGAFLLLAFATAVAGRPPYVGMLVEFAYQTMVSGTAALIRYEMKIRKALPWIPNLLRLSIVLPAVTFLLFVVIFVLANPDVVAEVQEKWRLALEAIERWLGKIDVTFMEFLFWMFVAFVTAGFLRPLTSLAEIVRWPKTSAAPAPAEAMLFVPFRNMLWSVIILFAAYLVFEFQTLWFREFPKGFYYAGYAHQGAAWLTVALALATAILSAVFAGPILRDPRLAELRRLAWIWSFENLLLAIAVYNRLFIYIGFNGMTRMRVIGLFGVTLVVVGFLLVIWKIVDAKGFPWLIQRQVWALAIAIYLFSVLPIDRFVVGYNVRRILNGDSSACMQIGVQGFDAEGVVLLPPLLECSDPEIRDGVAALLARQTELLRYRVVQQQKLGWTARQYAEQQADAVLSSLKDRLERYLHDAALRDAAIQRFHDYAYQWY